jgi:ethanolamine ammonia-lyase small subunit
MSQVPVLPTDADPWAALRQLTPARIALGRVGASLPTAEVLRFGVAHALARDAVHTPLAVPSLVAALADEGFPSLVVTSQAGDRTRYLMRPDLGRALDPAAEPVLRAQETPYDVALVVADGLSASAVQRHAVALLVALRARLNPALRVAPVVIATLARVALGDDIGACLGARLVVIALGERPGLSSPDSLSAYLTFQPRRGINDAQRNCVSNIHLGGLGYAQAAHTIAWLVTQALERCLTGVDLKDASDTLALYHHSPEKL